MKDFLGNELKQGDTVAYMTCGGYKLRKGIITGFREKPNHCDDRVVIGNSPVIWFRVVKINSSDNENRGE